MEISEPLQIVIVEDDLDTAENLRDIIEMDSHFVQIAHSAAEALQITELEKMEVILLDWKLPDATALEIMPRFKAAVPRADIVIVTGHGDFQQAVAALRQGAVDYLLKPINPAALSASLQRLSRQRQLTREKARSEAMFRNLVEAAPCLIVIIREDLSIAYFSPFAESLTGYSAQEVLNRNFLDVLLPNADIRDAQQLVTRLFADKNFNGHQTPIRCRDGTEKWLIWNARKIDGTGSGPEILAIGQDVTQFRIANEKLVQSARLSAIGEAMTGLAHESRNALQRSQAFLELLAVEVADDPDAQKLVGNIQEAQDHLHQLYEEVRQYAAPVRLELRQYALEDLLQQTWAYLEVSRQGRSAQLVSTAPCPSLEVSVDSFQIQQVFRNILENSLAACPEPAIIEYQCVPIQRNGKTWVQLTIRDNGPGMSAEQRQHIFDPFYTTKTRGTGLGMTLSKRIVEAHGGTITVADSGPGTTIVIEIPANMEELTESL